MRYIWDTPGMVEDLKTILEQGATAGEAARDLRRKYGFDVSRSAVIGKAYRLGFELRSQGSNTASVTPKANAKRPARTARKPIAIVRIPIMVDEPQPLGDVDGGCRWIFGEATLRNFCGHGTWPLSPWCPYHERRVFNSTVKSDARAALAEVA